jgi:hypothetical protein
MALERGDIDVLLGTAREQLWRHPSQSLAQPLAHTLPRSVLTTNVAAATTGLASGTLLLAGGAVLVPDQRVNGITVQFGTAVSSVTTNRWFCIVDQSLNVLAKTVDQGAVETTANQLLNLAITGGYLPPRLLPVYFGIVNVSTNQPDLRAASASFSVGTYAAAPALAGTSTAGLTNPASLGATAAAISAVNAMPVIFAT